MRRSPALPSLLLLLTACASQNTSPVGTGTRTVSISTAEGTANLRIRQDDHANEQVIALPADVLWKVLPAVYDSLGIPLSTINKAAMTIGVEGHKMRKSLKGVPLSRYFDCGTTQIGANADSYEVTLFLITRLKPAQGNSTKVEVTMIAQARPVERRQNPITCDTRGTLDAKLFATLKAEASR